MFHLNKIQLLIVSIILLTSCSSTITQTPSTAGKEKPIAPTGKAQVQAQETSKLALFDKQHSKSKVDYYLANTTSLDPIEGMYKFKLTFPSGREIISGDVGIVRLNTNKFMAFFYKSWKDSIPHGIWGFLNRSADPNIFYGDWTFGGKAENKEFRLNDGGINFEGYFQDRRVDCNLVRLYPVTTHPSTRKKTATLAGSGFLLSHTGLVVTNYHVIANMDNIEISFTGIKTIYTAEVVIKDMINDIAILRILDYPKDAEARDVPFKLARSSKVRLGEDVFTIGFPLGQVLGSQPRLSTGKISSFYGVLDDPRLFQISNPLQPGNSGGALFNGQGEIIGVVVASLNAKYFYEEANIIPQNVNFAIKSDYLINLISMFPGGEEILNPQGTSTAKDLKSQVEQFMPYIASIKASN